jgi:hypothetical protein
MMLPDFILAERKCKAPHGGDLKSGFSTWILQSGGYLSEISSQLYGR